MLKTRPKLLFLAYDFPPARATACVRTWNLAKYLTRLGWDVTVVTPHPSVWRYVDNPEKTDAALKREGILRILTDHRWRCLSPDHLNTSNGRLGWLAGGVCRQIARQIGVDNKIGWIQPAEQAYSSLTAGDVDIILASGPPFVVFRLAKRLFDRLGRPYVLDYRDPWTGNPHASRPIHTAAVKEEAKILADSAAVTIVSASWGSAMNHRFNLGSKLNVVTNGYDPEELVNVKPYDFGHFAIVYAGTFYPPKRVISPVMAALKRLPQSTNGISGEVFFHYYGSHESHVLEEARKFGVMEKVVVHGNVPRSEALSAVRGAGVAVVITSVTKNAGVEDKGIVTGKVFEALGLGTPILLIAPHGSDAEATIKETGNLGVFTGNDIDGLVSFLSKVRFGRIPRPKNTRAYAWTNIAKRFDAVLRLAMSGTIYEKREVSL